MRDYRLSPAAERDLTDIWRYTNKQWGRDQANRYTLGLKVMCQKLADAAQRGQNCAHIRPGYRRRAIEQHVIYFKMTNEGIAVARILHRRMDAIRHF